MKLKFLSNDFKNKNEIWFKLIYLPEIRVKLDSQFPYRNIAYLQQR